MANRLEGKKVAFLATDGVEQVELTEPWKKVEEEGGTPELVSLESGEIQGFNHLDKGDRFRVDRTVEEASESEYDGLVLPGGVANPDFLRMDENAVSFARSFFEAGKPVAVICHGPWTLVEADVVRERTITSWPSLRTDIRGMQVGTGLTRRSWSTMGSSQAASPTTSRRSARSWPRRSARGRHEQQAAHTR